MKAAQLRYETLTKNAPIGVFETDADGACEFINDHLASMVGRDLDDLRGDTWVETIHPEDRQRVFAEWMSTVASGEQFSMEYRLSKPDGEVTWVHGSAVAIRDGYDEVAGFIGTCLDITAHKTEQEQQEEQLTKIENLAHTDPLTGLPNRRWWDAELRNALAQAAGEQERLCVCLVDVDHFKQYNDEHGHPEGDRLLRSAAAAWSRALRGGDTIARYGGEEFAVLLPGCGEAGALPVIERLREDTPMGQTVSAGLATWEPWESPKALVERADAALYEAKRAGRNQSVLASEAAGINVSLNPTSLETNGDGSAEPSPSGASA
jgi:diguanylate cyclase (GGDEF)-like protein/PAS domain S-box-containing protein